MKVCQVPKGEFVPFVSQDDFNKCMCCGNTATLTINGLPTCRHCMLDGSAVQMVYQSEGAK